jgi:hypothetical protein
VHEYLGDYWKLNPPSQNLMQVTFRRDGIWNADDFLTATVAKRATA